MEIHIAREGRQLGPFSLEDIQRMLGTGEVTATDLAWTPGSANWVPLNTIPGVVVPPAADVPPAIPSAAAPPPYRPHVPMAAAPAAGVLMRRPTSSLAVTSLILGIVGLVFVPLLASIPAVITGHMARAEIKRSEGHLDGDGMAVAGLITGYISLIFWALMIVLVIVMFAAGVAIFPKLMNEINKLPAEPVAVADARMVALACNRYASDNEGKFPVKLEDLAPDYLTEGDMASLESHARGEFGGYEYIGGRTTDSPEKVLFFTKQSNAEGKHIVARVSGAVALEELPAELKERVPH